MMYCTKNQVSRIQENKINYFDTNDIPITYDLYSGNTNHCLTYRPTFSRIKKE